MLAAVKRAVVGPRVRLGVDRAEGRRSLGRSRSWRSLLGGEAVGRSERRAATRSVPADGAEDAARHLDRRDRGRPRSTASIGDAGVGDEQAFVAAVVGAAHRAVHADLEPAPTSSSRSRRAAPQHGVEAALEEAVPARRGDRRRSRRTGRPRLVGRGRSPGRRTVVDGRGCTDTTSPPAERPHRRAARSPARPARASAAPASTGLDDQQGAPARREPPVPRPGYGVDRASTARGGRASLPGRARERRCVTTSAGCPRRPSPGS